MKFVVEIDMSNAAFTEGPANLEIALILRRVVRQLEMGIRPREKLYDTNGNPVGTVRYVDEQAG